MLKYILIGIVAGTGFYAWINFPVQRAPGETIDSEPLVQSVFESPFSHEKYTLTPLRKINAEVRVIKKKRYFFDSKSGYAPVDILVGWHVMSDERILDDLNFRLNDRYFDVDMTTLPVNKNEMYGNIELWHLMPSDEFTDQTIKRIRDGHIVELEALLVHVESDDEVSWKSELQDPGYGHLKNNILWVKQIELK